MKDKIILKFQKQRSEIEADIFYTSICKFVIQRYLFHFVVARTTE